MAAPSFEVVSTSFARSCGVCAGSLRTAPQARCQLCGTSVHQECRPYLQGCATFGCPGRFASTPRRRRASYPVRLSVPCPAPEPDPLRGEHPLDRRRRELRDAYAEVRGAGREMAGNGAAEWLLFLLGLGLMTWAVRAMAPGLLTSALRTLAILGYWWVAVVQLGRTTDFLCERFSGMA